MWCICVYVVSIYIYTYIAVLFISTHMSGWNPHFPGLIVLLLRDRPRGSSLEVAIRFVLLPCAQAVYVSCIFEAACDMHVYVCVCVCDKMLVHMERERERGREVERREWINVWTHIYIYSIWCLIVGISLLYIMYVYIYIYMYTYIRTHTQAHRHTHIDSGVSTCFQPQIRSPSVSATSPPPTGVASAPNRLRQRHPSNRIW